MGGSRPISSAPELSPGRKLVFWLVLLAIPLGILAAVEGVVRLVWDDQASTDRYLTFTRPPSFFETVDIDGRPHYRVSHPQGYRARNITFPVEKPPGTIRILCVGGSASAGWPHPPNEIWTVDLENALRRAFPRHVFEVINVGAHANPSYRIRFIVERVLDFTPDFVMVYTGNNEFLETRTYLRRSRALEEIETVANHLATFRHLRNWALRVRYPENTLGGEEGINTNPNVWSKLARTSLELREDPQQYEALKEHFAATIRSMVSKAEQRGIPLLLATAPVNLRDWVPNVSINPLTGEDLEQWKRLVERGRGAMLRGENEEAVEILRRAVDAIPVHAEVHYRLGQALEQTGDYEAALLEFQRACDLDHNPFRSVSPFNDTLRSLAAENDGAHLVDLDAAFRAAAAPRAPGFDLFLDYVHPTKAGGVTVAETTFRALLRAGMMGDPPPAEARFVQTPVSAAGDVPVYDETLDNRLQSTLFWLFGVMHQYEAMVQKAERLRRMGSELPMLSPVLSVFGDYQAMERRRLLGEPVAVEERERVEARLAKYYKRVYGFGG